MLSRLDIRFTGQRKLILAVTLVAGVLVNGMTAPTASAAIPDSSGVIHSCYLNATGIMRAINAPSQSCTILETTLSWVQNSGARTYMNRLDIPSGSSSGPKTILEIPQFGKFTVPGEDCDLFNAFPNLITYENTSAQPQQPMVPGSGGILEIEPEDQQLLASYGFNGNGELTLSTTTGRVAFVTIYSSYNNSDTACIFTAKAEVK